ncbi:TPA: hypothetical protein N2B23_006055 [Pseudomonas aeruginosa]|nr:hypothetical protein [Pseudomonas aeruginosa]
MTDHAELRRLAERADALHGTPSLEHVFAITKFREAVEPKAILALLDEIDGMKASGWRNHSVNYARAEKCPQTLETAQAAWDRDQELIEEQRQQISRDSQTINQLRQKLQSAEVDLDRLKAENEAVLAANRDCIDWFNQIKTEYDECASTIPGVYYMDPPDGGDVSVPEQLRRMARDAARYRWLRDSCTRQWDVMYRDIEVVIKWDGADDCEDLDGIIDAALEGATQ